MTHPLLEPLVSQLPVTALSRKLIEENKGYQDIVIQLTHERNWLRYPESKDGDGHTGHWHLERNGYADWLKSVEEDDFVQMIGVLQLIFDTASALEDDEDD